MRRLSLLAALGLALAGCEPEQTTTKPRSGFDARRFHDDELHVTCWMSAYGYGDSISCLPDWQLQPPCPCGPEAGR